MRLLISRGRYQRITEGLSPDDVRELDEQVTIYPDGVEPELDQQRLADDYARLCEKVTAGALSAALATTGELVWQCGRQNGKNTRSGEIVNDAAQPARGMTSREVFDQWIAAVRPAQVPPRRIEAGETALAAILAAGIPPVRGWSKDTASAVWPLHALAGIPIVSNDDLEPRTWRLVNPVTGEVVEEHQVGMSLREYATAVREAVAELADAADTPRDYFLDFLDAQE